MSHPRGLFVAAATELSDRVSFHGMQALLVLYLVGQLLLPGHIEHVAGFSVLRGLVEAVTGPLSAQALASQLFGLYIGLIYLTPILGGLLGDRLLGRRWAVALGALLMTAGHFCLAFERLFLVAMALLVSGAGLLRGNLLSQVGDLYSTGDPRRERGFQIYYALATIGSFIAPLASGLLTQLYGWHYGFAFAGVWMLAGLIFYLCGRRYLPENSPRARHDGRPPQLFSDPTGRNQPPPTALTRPQRRVVVTLILMVPLLTLFWIAQAQVWDTYPIWVRDHVDLSVRGWQVPVPWLQAVDALASVAVVPPVLLFWRWQAARSAEPNDLSKLAIGCLVFGAAVLWLAGSGTLLATGTCYRIPLLWPVAFHFLSSVGWVYFGPTAVGIFSRAAPAPVNAMMIGVYHLSIFAGGLVAGRLGALYERLTSESFWLIHAAIVGGGALLLWLLASRLGRELPIGIQIESTRH